MTDQDPVGSAAEEAAKLLGVVAGWARDAEGHIANGEDCRYCPICRAVQIFRTASPEVREHLSTAAAALAQAVTAALATEVPDGRGAGVEHIDLDDDWADEGHDEGHDDGHDEGHDDGQDEGHDDGHDDGHDEATDGDDG